MITNNMYFYPRLCIFMRIPSFIVRTFRTFIPKLVILYGDLFGCNVALCKYCFYSFYTDYLCFFLVSFREHFAYLIHSWICANIKVFMAISFQNFQVWMSVVLGNFWSASPEGVTGGGHQRRSSEGVIGGGHRRGSPEGVTGGNHRRGSPEGVTESIHWELLAPCWISIIYVFK